MSRARDRDADEAQQQSDASAPSSATEPEVLPPDDDGEADEPLGPDEDLDAGALDLDDDDAGDDDDASSDDGLQLPDGSPTRRGGSDLTPVAYDDTAHLPSMPGSGASALSQYMAELKHHAPISREEEHELAVRWREAGDLQAARKLVVSNLRLVVKIAMDYRRAWTNTLDLIQEGNVGLMEAVQRYDPYQGVKLSSYAVYWIRAYILKYILDNMRSVRLGTTRASRKLFFRLNKEKALLERQGFEVGPKLIADRLDVSEQDVMEMEARLSRPDTSLDAPLRRDEDGGATVGDTFAAAGRSAESQVGDAELQRVFVEKMQTFAEGLGARDRQILEERVLAEDPKTLAELGEEFGVSRERVRQLEARLVDNLRAYMSEHLVDFEYYAAPATSKP